MLGPPRAACIAPAPPPPLERSSPACRGHRWFAALWLELTTRALPPPSPNSRYCAAYEFMSERPAAERDAVALTLRAAVRASPSLHWYTPLHVVDYWDRYVLGQPPGKRRSRAPERPDHLVQPPNRVQNHQCTGALMHRSLKHREHRP